MNEYSERSELPPNPQTNGYRLFAFAICYRPVVCVCQTIHETRGPHGSHVDNHIATTILHQAITKQGDTAARARVSHSRKRDP
jgi:hypothetical protein